LEALVEARTNELLEAREMLFQSDKLASVGQLAAGIAHEINTPTQYVGDNLRALTENFEDLCALITKYSETVARATDAPLPPECIEALEIAKREHDLDFILEDAPKALAQGLEGTGRIADIVRAMKDFSHVDRGEASVVDLNHALQSTLTVAKNEYKYVAEVATDFGDLPNVKCYVGELNQVFLNLIVNAAQAIAETNKRGRITIRTRQEGNEVVVSVSDTGTGIPDDIRQRVFDPFYTTKGIGKGTGQGLTIAHKIVVGKHGGSLDLDTEVGKGTTFTVRVPVEMVEIGTQ
jgi:signal transduction histidine kinase